MQELFEAVLVSVAQVSSASTELQEPVQQAVQGL